MSSFRSFVAGVLIAVCAALEQGGAAPEDKVTVEVDMFSGRPNPTWTMASGDARATVTMLDRLLRTTPGTVEERLGYRGTIIRVNKIAWRVFRGQAIESASGLWKADEGRKLERFALASGKSILDPDLYKTILKEAGFDSGNAEEKHED